jgi:hypothetical protein
MHCHISGKDKCTSIYGVGHMPMTHPNGDTGFLPLARQLGDASSPSPAADTQTSDITNDVICAQTTHAAYCHWTAINSYARMFYAWTMYFRYKDCEILCVMNCGGGM